MNRLPRAADRRAILRLTGADARSAAARRAVRALVAACALATACARLPPVALTIASASGESCRRVEPDGAPQPQWLAPSGRESQARLSRWCRTVGPVFFASPAAAEQRVDRLAIVSWNIHEGRGDVDEVVRRLRLGEFTSGQPIEQFVLLLQEATRRGPGVPSSVPRGYPSPRRISGLPGRPHDVRRFADAGLAVFYAPSMRNGEVDGEAEDRGNAIVSTLALEDPRLIELPLERQRRVALVAAAQGRRKDGKPWRLGLVDVHLDTAPAWLHGGPFAARRRQALALVDGLRVLSGFDETDDSAVVAGDFNAWLGGREPAVTIVRDRFPAEISAGAGPTWIGPLGVRARLDHIFVRGPLAAGPAARLPSRFGSDHYPLLTVIEF